MTQREYLDGVPQATEREADWARSVAHMIVHMVQQHRGEIKGDAEELVGQIAHELRASVAILNGGQLAQRRFPPARADDELYSFDPMAEVSAPNERHHYFKMALSNYDGECMLHVPENLYDVRVSRDGSQKRRLQSSMRFGPKAWCRRLIS